jgi:hypothetical protein
VAGLSGSSVGGMGLGGVGMGGMGGVGLGGGGGGGGSGAARAGGALLAEGYLFGLFGRRGVPLRLLLCERHGPERLLWRTLERTCSDALAERVEPTGRRRRGWQVGERRKMLLRCARGLLSNH